MSNTIHDMKNTLEETDNRITKPKKKKRISELEHGMWGGEWGRGITAVEHKKERKEMKKVLKTSGTM